MSIILFVAAGTLLILAVQLTFSVGQPALGLWAAMAGFGLIGQIPMGGRPHIRGFWVILCDAFAVFMLYASVSTLSSAQSPPFGVFEDSLGSHWSVREAGRELPALSNLIATDPRVVCQGSSAFALPTAGNSVQKATFYHHWVPVARDRFFVDRLEFQIRAELVKDDVVTVRLQTDPRSFAPPVGVSIETSAETPGRPGCRSVRIPLSELRVGDRGFWGIQFESRSPSVVVLDDIRLIERPNQIQ